MVEVGVGVMVSWFAIVAFAVVVVAVAVVVIPIFTKILFLPCKLRTVKTILIVRVVLFDAWDSYCYHHYQKYDSIVIMSFLLL